MFKQATKDLVRKKMLSAGFDKFRVWESTYQIFMERILIYGKNVLTTASTAQQKWRTRRESDSYIIKYYIFRKNSLYMFIQLTLNNYLSYTVLYYTSTYWFKTVTQTVTQTVT